jgi:hypothetical protein
MQRTTEEGTPDADDSDRVHLRPSPSKCFAASSSVRLPVLEALTLPVMVPGLCPSIPVT